MDRNRFNALAYGTMGIGTEGGMTAYELKVCRNAQTHEPIAASGHAVGAMQFDFGQRGKEPDPLVPGKNKAESYFEAANAWAIAHGREPLDADTVRKLQTHNVPASTKHPNGIKRFEDLPAESQASLEAFGRTSEGRQWMFQHLEKPLLDSYYDKVNPVLETKAFAKWSDQEKIVAATTLAKAYNQSPTGFNAIVHKLENKDSSYTPADFKTAVKEVEEAHAAASKDHKSSYAFSKAHDLAKAVAPLYANEAVARELDGAGAKLASKTFDPSSIAIDSQLQLLKRVNAEPAFLQKTKDAIQAGTPLPNPLHRPPFVTAFETQPLAQAVALYPKELAGAGHAMTSAALYAKQFPLSLQADFMTDVKGRITEHLCKNGPLPLPAQQVQHTPSPQQAPSHAVRHDLVPRF